MCMSLYDPMLICRYPCVIFIALIFVLIMSCYMSCFMSFWLDIYVSTIKWINSSMRKNLSWDWIHSTRYETRMHKMRPHTNCKFTTIVNNNGPEYVKETRNQICSQSQKLINSTMKNILFAWELVNIC